MDEFAVNFGMTMGQLVAQYRSMFAWFAPLFHIATLFIMYLVFRYGNRYRKAFTLYFMLNYLWLVIFVGGWFGVQLYRQLGMQALAMYGGTPLLLLIILYQWIQEFRRPRLDLDFRSIPKWRMLLSVPFFVWGFWYPPYEWGVGMIFDLRELLLGAYGLMGCPTTLVALAILLPVYPKGNRPLFHALTAYAVIIGAGMVALLYVPDIPFFLFGVISLVSVVWNRLHENSMQRGRRKSG